MTENPSTSCWRKWAEFHNYTMYFPQKSLLKTLKKGSLASLFSGPVTPLDKFQQSEKSTVGKSEYHLANNGSK